MKDEKGESIFKGVEKLKANFYSPAYLPGTKVRPFFRWWSLIDEDGEPQVESIIVKYDPPLRCWSKWYCFFHFIALLAIFFHFEHDRANLCYLDFSIKIAFFIFTMQCFSAFFDHKSCASFIETVRCIAVIAYYFYLMMDNIGVGPNRLFMLGFFASSTAFCVEWWHSPIVVLGDAENASCQKVGRKVLLTCLASNCCALKTIADYRAAFFVDLKRNYQDDQSDRDAMIHLQHQIGQNLYRKQKQKVEEWVQNTLQKGVEGIIAEYDQIDKLPNNAALYGDRDNVKNRYRDIGCIDKTRVRLKDVDASLDYIHANYIRSTKRKKRFICTQAPLDITVEDFWHMVCQEHSEYIVMLCGLVEDNFSVCAEYWPQKEGERLQFQDFEIRNAGTLKIECIENNEKFTVTKSRLHVNSRMGAHICSHLFWSQWADRKPPPSFEIIRRIAREVRRTRKPIIVHCSTGVGRAGTFVAIELLLETLMNGYKCDMPKFLSGLRQQRAMAINSCMQYIGVYQQTMEYFKKERTYPRIRKNESICIHCELLKRI